MFDFPLFWHAITHAFSLRKGNLHYPTLKRLFSVFVVLPLFLMLTLINRSFMLIDYVLFPGFREVQQIKAAFITGVPRSATTYAYNLLAKDGANFTCFRMWELLFAPSVTQRYLLAFVLRIDRLMGRPLYRMSLWCDRIFLGQIARLHETGLSKPEEDETLLLYAFASTYLIFFFPDVPALNQHLYFDEEVQASKRKKIMHFYYRCVQRHIYFHDPTQKKIFLSKNPAFVSKTTSLAETFEHARLIYMLRSPAQTIPSTIKLNRNIFSMISGDPVDKTFEAKTRDTVLRWYRMAARSVSEHWHERSMTVSFESITREPAETLQQVYQFLELIPKDPPAKSNGPGRSRVANHEEQIRI